MAQGYKDQERLCCDDALLSQLYLITMQVIKLWTMLLREWSNILMHRTAYFGDPVKRFPITDNTRTPVVKARPAFRLGCPLVAMLR